MRVRLEELLRAYARVVDRADRLPRAPVIRRSETGFGRHVRLPRHRPLLLFFVVNHINGRLDEIARGLAARAALIDRDTYRRHLDTVSDFRASLPAVVRRRTVVVVSVAVALVVSRFVGARLGSPPGKQPELLDSIQAALLTIGSGGLDDAFSAVVRAPALELVGLFLLALLWFAAIIRLLASSFRIKRLLLNSYPPAPGDLGNAGLAENSQRARGVYQLETRLLGELGLRPRREVPLDLVASALPALLWLGFWLYVCITAKTADPDATGIILYLLVLAPAYLRLQWLLRAWRRRGLTDQPLLVDPLVALMTSPLLPLLWMSLWLAAALEAVVGPGSLSLNGLLIVVIMVPISVVWMIWGRRRSRLHVSLGATLA